MANQRVLTAAAIVAAVASVGLAYKLGQQSEPAHVDAVNTASDHLSAQSTPEATEGALRVCKARSQAFAQLMEARQAGVPMARVMETTSDTTDMQHQADMRRWVIAAYDTPRFSDPQLVKQLVRDFENDAYLDCVRNLASG